MWPQRGLLGSMRYCEADSGPLFYPWTLNVRSLLEKTPVCPSQRAATWIQLWKVESFFCSLMPGPLHSLTGSRTLSECRGQRKCEQENGVAHPFQSTFSVAVRHQQVWTGAQVQALEKLRTSQAGICTHKFTGEEPTEKVRKSLRISRLAAWKSFPIWRLPVKTQGGGCFLQGAEPNTKFPGKERNRPQSEIHITSLQMDAKATEVYESPAKLLKINTLHVFNVLLQGVHEPKGK